MKKLCSFLLVALGCYRWEFLRQITMAGMYNGIFEALGATVDWNGDTNTVILNEY